jgi:integrase
MSVYRPKYKDPKTGEVKESAVWWFEFSLAGRRVRKSANTTRKTIAVEAEKQERLRFEKRLAGIPEEKLTDRIRTIAAALKEYSESYPVNHRENSVTIVNERRPHLERLLGSVLIPDVTEERVRQYMRTRQGEGASGRTINIELGVLSRAMGHTWRVLWPKVKKLSERSDVGRALSPEQEERILRAAAANKSRMLYPFVRIALLTGMRHDEIRQLCWEQVDFERKQVAVGRAKTATGTGRVIPMGPMLSAVLDSHASWYAEKLGPIQPGWFVFPFSNRRKPVDPTRPVVSLKRGWNSARKAAGVECRFHDLRHTVCTKMAEAGVPESTMLDIMGHMSTAMLRRYSHIRQAAKRDAMNAVELRSALAFSVGVPKDSPKVGLSGAPKVPVTH